MGGQKKISDLKLIYDYDRGKYYAETHKKFCSGNPYSPVTNITIVK